MKSNRYNLVLPAAALLACVAVGLHSAPASHLASTALAAQGAAAATGLGFWDTLSCIGCIAGFVVGAGTTVAGFAVFLAANPEIGILCVSSCINAAT
jgi:hypothetical protein